MSPRWQFAIDVGGTFTDGVAFSPEGEVRTAKVLSSSAVKGKIGSGSQPGQILDAARRGEVEDFYRGYEVVLLDANGVSGERRPVGRFDGAGGAILPDPPFASLAGTTSYELRSPEEAPLLAVRKILGLRLADPIHDLDLRLGTTRGTNTLLERKGPRTAFVTTEGFADVLRIGNQDRPRLFEFAIRKPAPLFEATVEVRERLAADGRILVPLDLENARRRLGELRERGVEALAICLLHSYRDPVHEEALARLARELGFHEVALSSTSAPFIKLVPRGDTAVVDAYLTPVLESYVESIEKRAPRARLRLLTSAGGLAAPSSFRGKDSILSGPAGGVVGAARAAEAVGFRRVIGFDMGGTSTDVCRYDGSFDMEFETEKAGVRVVTPLLAIETVAAGGGSVCDFDGERLTVGPESAGARPGPACYGGGGPLTVTDVNFFLGRVPEERFPFPLDRIAVERRLGELSKRLAEAGHERSLPCIAEGFLEIANARMAAAIRKISVARGYDVREYVLVAFGGAGPQHACAVARELGIREVLVPGLAGVLSAYGAGVADVRKFAERSLLRPHSDGLAAELEPLFRELEEAVRTAVAADGALPEHIEPPRRELEMRYAGQDATLTVDTSVDGVGDWRHRFEDAHRRLFGYVHPGRALEVVSARVECVGKSRDVSDPAQRGSQRRESSSPRRLRSAVFAGQEVPATLVDLESFHLDETVVGAAVVAADYHTVVVEPGWSATRDRQGNLFLTRQEHAPAASRAPGEEAVSREVDPARLEIFHQHFAAIAEEMGLVLRKSALSTNIRERLDFSCAVFDSCGGLVANAPHIPVHLGAMGECVQHVARDIEDLGPGDVVVTNDPFRGGSHLPDVTVVTPVHEAESGDLLLYVASRAHHAEIGGKRPGSMPPDSRCLAEEGVVIRSFRAVKRGKERLGELRRRLEEAPYPSRDPAENMADIEAQIAANRRGVDLLLRLIERAGRETVLSYMGHIQVAARRLMEAQLRKLSAGGFEFVDAMDDGSQIRVDLRLEESKAVLDFTGSARRHPGNLNATPAIVSSAVLYCFRSLMQTDIPLNSGVLAPIELVLPECFLNPAVAEDAAHCAAVAGGNVETSQRIVDVVLGALGVAAASQGTMNNLIFGNERFGYYETIAGGAGAGPRFAGADAVHTHMTNTRITDVEVLESRYPVRLRRFAIRRGSGGEGKYRGGDGVIRELEFLDAVEVSILSQRRTRPPYGLAGGQPGLPGRNLLRRKGESAWDELPPIITFQASPGDVLRIETPGGGGWGERPG